MFNKKAIELGLNTIVIAVIALAVLLVVIIVFSGRFGIFSGQLQDCRNVGGEVITADVCQKKNGRIVFNVTDSSNVCCVSASSLIPGVKTDEKE
jgi:hypothetical protein